MADLILPEKKRASSKMTELRIFKYRGVKVVIRKWGSNIYEFLLAIGGEIYCDYYEARYSNSSKKNEDLVNQIVSNLCNGAVATIDFHKRSGLVKLKEKIKLFYEQRIRGLVLKPKEPAETAGRR